MKWVLKTDNLLKLPVGFYSLWWSHRLPIAGYFSYIFVCLFAKSPESSIKDLDKFGELLKTNSAQTWVRLPKKEPGKEVTKKGKCITRSPGRWRSGGNKSTLMSWTRRIRRSRSYKITVESSSSRSILILINTYNSEPNCRLFRIKFYGRLEEKEFVFSRDLSCTISKRGRLHLIWIARVPAIQSGHTLCSWRTCNVQTSRQADFSSRP